MREMFWDSALLVRLQNGVERIFSGPYDALDFLENEWPVRKIQAKRAAAHCREALEGTKSTSAARQSFIIACAEAGLPVSCRGGKPVALATSDALRTVDHDEAGEPRWVA